MVLNNFDLLGKKGIPYIIPGKSLLVEKTMMSSMISARLSKKFNIFDSYYFKLFSNCIISNFQENKSR